MNRDEVMALNSELITKIEAAYKRRDKDPGAFDDAIRFCQQHILMAPAVALAIKSVCPNSPLPSHRGFKQLAIIREKQGRYEEAIQIVEEAMNQGWCMGFIKGPAQWQSRLDRCRKKLEKRG